MVLYLSVLAVFIHMIITNVCCIFFISMTSSRPANENYDRDDHQPFDDNDFAKVEDLPSSKSDWTKPTTSIPQGKMPKLETIFVTADIFFKGDGKMGYQIKRSWHG